jgi:hypothetical protein
MRRRRWSTVALLLGLAVVVLAMTVSAPADVGRWTPVALDGAALNAVVAMDGMLVVGGPVGAWRLADGRVVDLDLDAAVEDLLVRGDRVLGATDAGVLEVRGPGEHATVALDGVAVDALLEHRDRVLAVADGGVYDVDATTPVVEPDAGVRSATSVDGTLLLGLDDGVGEPDGEGGVERRWRGAAVDLLLGVPEADGTRLLAAVPAADGRLLAANDPAGPWERSDDGIRLATVEGLATHPTGEGRVLAGGTGLDDGESGERGGIADSSDAGRSWTNEQDRLSAVHVYDFASRDEPLRVRFALAGRDLGSLALPVTRPHTYAGTNGAGLYRRQPELPGAATAATLEPVGRFAAPAALGALVLWIGWRAFLLLAGRSRRRPTVLRATDPRDSDPTDPDRAPARSQPTDRLRIEPSAHEATTDGARPTDLDPTDPRTKEEPGTSPRRTSPR